MNIMRSARTTVGAAAVKVQRGARRAADGDRPRRGHGAATVAAIVRRRAKIVVV
jgi:hypothetical protein